jgi:ABC-type oligopeptide transport system substrate-binding subunit
MAAIPTEALIAQSPKTRIAANSIIPRGMPGAPNPFTVIAKGDGHSASASLPEQTLTLAYPKDSLSQSIAEQIQSTTAQTGKLKIIAEALPSNDAQVLHTLAKRYDLVLTLFGLDYHDPDQLLSSFLAQGTHDLFNTSSADLLEILQRARNSTKEAERDRIYAAAAEYLQAKIAIVMPLFYRRRAYLLRPTFHLQKGASGTAKIQKIH